MDRHAGGVRRGSERYNTVLVSIVVVSLVLVVVLGLVAAIDSTGSVLSGVALAIGVAYAVAWLKAPAAFGRLHHRIIQQALRQRRP